MSRTCRVCGGIYESAYRTHLAMTGHVRSRSSRHPDDAFLASVREHRDRTVADVGADFGLQREAAKRAAAKAGVFRRGRRASSIARDRAVILRARDGATRRQLADEYGLSLSHIYFILRVARAASD